VKLVADFLSIFNHAEHQLCCGETLNDFFRNRCEAFKVIFGVLGRDYANGNIGILCCACELNVALHIFSLTDL
jgi:hypothetical protein